MVICPSPRVFVENIVLKIHVTKIKKHVIVYCVFSKKKNLVKTYKWFLKTTLEFEFFAYTVQKLT